MLTDTTLALVPYIFLAVGALYALALIADAIAEHLAPAQTAKVKMAIGNALRRDPRTKAQRDLDDAFMAIVATYHREA